MNKHDLQKRIDAIDQQLVSIAAQYNKLIGQKEECLHWLQQHAIKDAAECKDEEALKEMLGASEFVDLNAPLDGESNAQAAELPVGQGGC